MHIFLIVLITIISIIICGYLLYLWIKILININLWFEAKTYESKQNAENIELQNKILKQKINKIDNK